MAAWHTCSSCKQDIGFNTRYWLCNVSTCNRKRVGFFFCSVSCWEAHLPGMRHRESWAVEERSPSEDQWKSEQAAEALAAKAPPTAERPAGTTAPPRRVMANPVPASSSSSDFPTDILVVASKLKKYIKARSGMNTSDNVMPVLSAHMRRVCDMAIRKAAEDGRRTVLDRDFSDVTR